MGGYAGELLHGEYLVYDKEKNLITKGGFAYGLKQGIWKYWNSQGILRYTVEYKDGLLDGEYIRYKQDGEVDFIHKYQDGKRQSDHEGLMRIWKSSAEGNGKNNNNSIQSDTVSGKK